MNSDLDKDEFCKMWVKMNKTRVQAAKVERMLKSEEECYRDALYNFYLRIDGIEAFTTPLGYIKVTAYEIQAMSYAGIKVANEYGGIKYVSDIRHEIGKYLGMF